MSFTSYKKVWCVGMSRGDCDGEEEFSIKVFSSYSSLGRVEPLFVYHW